MLKNADDTKEGHAAGHILANITKKPIGKKGKSPATSADFKPGSKVYVAPRMLPSGGIMAIGISETPQATARLKERSKPTLSGTVKAISAEKKTLSIHSLRCDDRNLNIAVDVVVRPLLQY